MPHLFPRSSGILLHPTSLPGPHGIGELGPEAYEFVDFLANAGQSIWQVLPLGPTGFGDSPYQSFSAFAGNPLLISLEALRERGLPAVKDVPHFPEDQVDFGRVIEWKSRVFAEAWQHFDADASPGQRARFEKFRRREAWWLNDFTGFMSTKGRDPGETAFLQWIFFDQWSALKTYANDRGIRILGDVPIYVAGDSADVWAHPEMFQPDKLAGVPPDYFSPTGQLWGNPLYRWDVIAASGYRWWIDRLRATLRLFDYIRLDHFRGFEAYWEVRAPAVNAVDGQWVKGPGAELLRAVSKALGRLPIVAENLGVITPEVEAIRHEFGLPGMAILQFAFGDDPQGPSFRPHNYPRNLVAYTGTHDNDTTVGWWTRSSTANERDVASRYLHTHGHDVHWVFIRALMASVADVVLFPLQDVLGLGSEARMNLPATSEGNWRWRVRRDALTPEAAARLRDLGELYGRISTRG